MKRVLNINSQRGFVRLSADKKAEKAQAEPTQAAQPKRRRSLLSSLNSTGVKTADDVRRAIAQGRFAELKPDQA